MGDESSPSGRAPASDTTVQRKLLGFVVEVLSELDKDFHDMDVDAADLEMAIKNMKATSVLKMNGLTE